jgi:hypothetical protein
MIPAEHWERVRTDALFWQTGDVDYEVADLHNSYTSHVSWRLYDVRFDPEAVREIVGSAGIASPPVEATTGPEPEQKAPRVADAHLRAWYEFYKTVTPEAEDTEDYAWGHAKRCFPDKTVSRDRVRDLRGSLKRGPKPKATLADKSAK